MIKNAQNMQIYLYKKILKMFICTIEEYKNLLDNFINDLRKTKKLLFTKKTKKIKIN